MKCAACDHSHYPSNLQDGKCTRYDCDCKEFVKPTLEQWQAQIEERLRALEIEMASVTFDDQGRGFDADR